jgi:hypothetical protein
VIVPQKTKIDNQTTIDCDFHGKTGQTALRMSCIAGSISSVSLLDL